MKNFLFVVLLLGVLTVGCTQKVVPGSANVDDDIVMNQVLVVLKPDVERKTVEATYTEYNLQLNNKKKRDGEISWIATFNNKKIRADKLLVKLSKDPNIKEANFVEVTETD